MWCWASVTDGGSTLNRQCMGKVPYLLLYHYKFKSLNLTKLVAIAHNLNVTLICLKRHDTVLRWYAHFYPRVLYTNWVGFTCSSFQKYPNVFCTMAFKFHQAWSAFKNCSTSSCQSPVLESRLHISLMAATIIWHERWLKDVVIVCDFSLLVSMHKLNSVYTFSSGTVFIRQNLTSADVRFWRIKTIPALKELKYV